MHEASRKAEQLTRNTSSQKQIYRRVAPQEWLRGPLRTLGVICCFSFLLPVRNPAQEVLNNDSVLKMVKAGLSDSVVLDMVRSSPGQYDLTTDRVIDLKHAGVTENVLRAMIAKGEKNANANPQDRFAFGNVESVSSAWDVHESRDKLTQELVRIEASKRVTVEQGGKFEVTASCGRDKLLDRLDDGPNQFVEILQQMGAPVKRSDAHAVSGTKHLDDRFLSIRFLYLPASGSGLTLRLSSIEQTVTRGTLFTQPTVSALKSCAFLRVLVDDHGREGVQSGACNTPNVASVDFANVRASEIINSMLPAGNPLNDTVGKLTAGLADARDPSIATMREVFAAKRVMVELPLSNGDSAVVGLGPQELSFQEFASRCLATFPDTTSRPADLVPGEPAKVDKPLPKPVVGLTKADREYSGSVEGFAASLPGFMQRAALAAGMEPTHYGAETDRLLRVAGVCSHITPEAARKVTKFGLEMLSTLGPEYRDCEAALYPASVRGMVPGETERRIVFSVRPLGAKWSDGRGFKMTVLFTPLQGDEGAGTTAATSFRSYGIVSASLLSAK
jgi:hypothetical protein